jgi:hypothetical protein
MKDIEKIKQLREETGVSYAMCTQALNEAKGDMAKARELLKQKGAEVAAKKAERETGQGAIFTYVHHNKRIGAMATVLCETDFVAMNDDFKKLNDVIGASLKGSLSGNQNSGSGQFAGIITSQKVGQIPFEIKVSGTQKTVEATVNYHFPKYEVQLIMRTDSNGKQTYTLNGEEMSKQEAEAFAEKGGRFLNPGAEVL